MDFEPLKKRMDGALDALHRDFSGLRTGRASTSLLEPIQVDAYGSSTPLKQVGTVGVPEPRLLTVQVWDRGLVSSVEKAIRDSGLGLNPQSDGNLIRVPLPDLSQERRQELVRVAGKYAEQARIAIRNIRRDGMDEVKKAQKNSEISEDELKDFSQEIQDLTDSYVKKVDEALSHKETDITTV